SSGWGANTKKLPSGAPVTQYGTKDVSGNINPS
ncbi:MAG: hypothetical protein ACI892_001729, partial [Marinobacter maritimus]